MRPESAPASAARIGLSANVTGACGVLAGLLLAGELSAFLLSGWSAAKFADPRAAIEVIRDGGDHLRLAAFLGFAGLAATLLLTAGLAERLRRNSPTASAAFLLFSLVGIAGHALVPLALWVGVPAFTALGASSPAAAHGSWTAFNLMLAAAQQVGSLFVGLASISASAALFAARHRLLGWTAAAAGAATLVTVTAPGVGLARLATAAFLPALAFTIGFRIAAGTMLWRGRPVPRRAA